MLEPTRAPTPREIEQMRNSLSRLNRTPLPGNQYETVCAWCRRVAISFVQPPAMVEVSSEPDGRKSVDRICLDCYGELLRLQASRATLPTHVEHN